MSEDRAASDLREYGSVLTEVERLALVKHRKLSGEVGKLVESLAKTEYYAGARVVPGSGPFLWEKVEVMVTEPSAKSVKQALTTAADLPVEVDVVEVRSTWDELEHHSDAVRAGIGLSKGTVGAEYRELAEDSSYRQFMRADRVRGVGYSIAANEVVLYTDDPGLVARSLVVGDLPLLWYAKWEPGVDDGMCDEQGCSGPRAGIEIEKAGNNSRCTLGIPVRHTLTGDRDYTTADHCDASGWDLQFPSWASLGHVVDGRLAAFNSRHPTSSRVDADILEVSDHRVTDRILALGNRGQQISGTSPYGSNLLNDRVCHSGAVSGIACGVITDIGRSKETQDGVLLTNQVVTDYDRANGDSGGPVYSEARPWVIYGWHQGEDSGDPIFSSVSFLGDMQANTVLFTTDDTRRDWLLKLYGVALGRLPNAHEFNYWRNTVNGGSCNVQRGRDTVWVVYLTAPEFDVKRPASPDPNQSSYRRMQRIRLLYWGALGRDPALPERTYWNGIYESHGWDDVVYSIVFSSEFAQVYSNGGNSYDGKIC